MPSLDPAKRLRRLWNDLLPQAPRVALLAPDVFDAVYCRDGEPVFVRFPVAVDGVYPVRAGCVGDEADADIPLRHAYATPLPLGWTCHAYATPLPLGWVVVQTDKGFPLYVGPLPE